MSQSNKNISCQVCNNPTAKLRYNSYVCNACRVFFARHWDSNFMVRCDTNGTCEISYQKQRVNCAACRLKKCYDVNMTKTGSNNGVVDRLQKTHNSYVEMKKLTEMFGEIMNNGFRVAGHLQNSQSNNEWIDCLMHYDSTLLAVGGKSPSACVANTNMTLNDCLMFPGSCMDRATAVFDSIAVVDPSLPYKFTESIIRVVVAAVEQMSYIEEFHQLLPIDRIRLVQQNAFKLSSFVLLFLKHQKGWDDQANMHYMRRFKMADGVGSQYNRILAVWTSPTCHKAFALMEEVQPTAKEFLLLRVRAMFRPYPSMSSDGYALALKIRLKITYRLAEYLRETYSNLTEDQLRERLLKLLEFESYIEVCILR